MDLSTRGTSISYISIIYIFAIKVVYVSASKIDLYSANLFLAGQIVYSLNMKDRCILSHYIPSRRARTILA